MACALLLYRSAQLNVVRIEPKGSKCNIKNLKWRNIFLILTFLRGGFATLLHFCSCSCVLYDVTSYLGWLKFQEKKIAVAWDCKWNVWHGLPPERIFITLTMSWTTHTSVLKFKQYAFLTASTTFRHNVNNRRIRHWTKPIHHYVVNYPDLDNFGGW